MNKPKLGLTSVEAAALMVSGGVTKDPVKAEYYAHGKEMDMDALQKAHLRRMMGFDFTIKQTPNKLHVYSKEGPQLSTSAKLQPGDTDTYDNIISDAAIDRLVNACLRLKLKHEAEVRRLEAAKK